ncbi:MAG: phosphatidylserine decarboxylase family protein [Ignavibacteria bacterium]|nr:phosphatidylserine decarboxylase family protein [Ignavibacteria bacterium]
MTVLGLSILFFIEESFPDLDILLKLVISTSIPILFSVFVIAYFFFRDPERNPPNKKNIILSPADGKVIYINEITSGEFPIAVKGKNKIPLSEFTSENFISGKGIQIGIAMSFLHVHVNRSPIDGNIVRIKRVPGLFNSLKHISSLLENERVFTQINSERIKLGIVQIASRLVRRIDSYKKENEGVTIGERIGIIKFGSQVDLIIDKADIKILTKVGDEVKAGLSILAEY